MLTMLRRKTTHTRVNKDILSLLKSEAERQNKTTTEMLNEVVSTYLDRTKKSLIKGLPSSGQSTDGVSKDK
jgi:hypothetical protein